jgi:hypothetical protein
MVKFPDNSNSVTLHVGSRYGIKWPRCQRTSALGPLARYWRPPSMVTGSRARAEPGHKDELDWANKW